MPKISQDIEQKITQDLLPDMAEEQEKVAYVMCGIPASGKTTYVEKQIQEGNFPSNAFILNPDIVMEKVDNYQSDKEEIGAEEAFKRWEIPSRTLAYKLFHQAQEQGRTIIIDMGCAREENRQMLASLKELGYKVFMTHMKCDVETAIERTATRDRFTPPDVIYRRHDTLQILLRSYRHLAEEFTEIDTSN